MMSNSQNFVLVKIIGNTCLTEFKFMNISYVYLVKNILKTRFKVDSLKSIISLKSF